jgi:type II secretory pathway pseudopilin PulG
MRQENSNSNSTLPNACECLVILIFIGVIGAIAVPSALNMVNKAKQSESKQYISSMNRAQQAKFAEDGAFATSVDALKLGRKTETINYKYSLRATQTGSFHYALAKGRMLKNYIGAVFLVPAYPNAPKDAMTTTSILCEADDRPLFSFKPADKPAEPTYQNGEVICGKGTTAVTK